MAGSIYLTLFGAGTVTAPVTVSAGRNMSGQASTDTLKAATAAAYTLSDGTTPLLVVDTRKAVTVQNYVFDMPAAQTLPDGATSRFRAVSIAAHTVTLAGTTQVTTVNQGVGLFIGAITYNQSGGAVTVDQVSALHVSTPVAGSSVTISAIRIISTDDSTCYLTNGGVWTDHSCFADAKRNIMAATRDAIAALVDKLTPRTWQYTEHHGDDMGRQRLGIVFDELPGELRAPGEKIGVSGSLLASFALAAIKTLWDENRDLKDRLNALEAKAA